MMSNDDDRKFVMRPGGAEHDALLAEINADIPSGVDWTRGALNYVAAEFEKHGREACTHYMLTKPFAPVGPGEAGRAARLENWHYLTNFVNAFGLLDLPGGTAILDVACGSGWVSQFFARMGYPVYGFDLCLDMVELTRRRLREDVQLASLAAVLDKRIFALDIERQQLPPELHGQLGAIILESCLHHFVDPVTALSHLAAGLDENGLVMIVEGENRADRLRPEYIEVMREFDTLERPYTRRQLERMLLLVGLPHYCFLGRLNGWLSPDDPALDHLKQRVQDDAAALNFVVCARTPEALQRIVPHYVATERAPTLPRESPLPDLPALESSVFSSAEVTGDQSLNVRDSAEAKEDPERTIAALTDRLHAAEAMLAATRRSTSWRLTAPVRQLGRIVPRRHRDAG